MRFQLYLKPVKGSLLPINYNYLLSSWVYRKLDEGDAGFAAWLHSEGLRLEGKRFKGFTFSSLYINECRLMGDRLKILAGPVKVQLSFILPPAAENFIMGLFKGAMMELGDWDSKVTFRITEVRRMFEPVFSEEMHFKTLSPVFVSRPEVGQEGKIKAQFLSPEDPDFSRILHRNLVNKAAALFTGPGEWWREVLCEADMGKGFDFCLRSKPKSKLLTIKEGRRDECQLRGFQFRFSVTASPGLQRLGYYHGFGSKNSLGFGCVAIERKPERRGGLDG